MVAVFFGMIVVAGAGVAVASHLAAYAQRHWTRQPQLADGTTGALRPRTVRPLGDVAGFGEQLHTSAVRYGYAEARSGR